MTKHLTTYLVGAYHRPPARLILEHLPQGTPLILDPEPSNIYDPEAIRVSVELGLVPESEKEALDQELPGYGIQSFDALIKNPLREGCLHLGYIPASGGKAARGGPGTKEVGELLLAQDHRAELRFDPTGLPQVWIETGQVWIATGEEKLA